MSETGRKRSNDGLVCCTFTPYIGVNYFRLSSRGI